MIEAAGNMHMHTYYSDGEGWHDDIANAAIEAGLDFVIVTDHNIWVDGIEGYYENENGRVLLLVGEEVHNVRRKPQASHFLAYGADRELSSFAADPQRLIDETNAAGGYGFLAHPHERDVPIVNETNLGWHDWDIDGFAGLEIWNYMSNLKDSMISIWERMPIKSKHLAMLYTVRLAGKPEQYITQPEPKTLALWDKLLAQGKQISAIGGSDAHAAKIKVWPIFERILYPYAFLFRAVNTHLTLPHAFTGDFATDKKMVLDAIGNGRSWIGYDMPHPTAGFRFTGQGRTKGGIGDQIKLDAGATLQVKTSTKANIRIIRHGEVVASIENNTNLTHLPTESGAYRVECTINYAGKERGWIYSNPIYLR